LSPGSLAAIPWFARARGPSPRPSLTSGRSIIPLGDQFLGFDRESGRTKWETADQRREIGDLNGRLGRIVRPRDHFE
jgi:hypothetical protein